MNIKMSDVLHGIIYVGLIVCGFAVGANTNNHKDCVTPIANIVSIDGQLVEVVDFMYRYTNENNEEVHGDYSVVLQNGYEYTEEGTYSKEYQNAVIKIGE